MSKQFIKSFQPYRNWESKPCPSCGRLFWMPKFNLLRTKHCSRHCQGISNYKNHSLSDWSFKKGFTPWSKGTKGLAPLGANHCNWKGGRSISVDGYVITSAHGHPCATKNGGYVLEHRLIIEAIIGRILLDYETVHHVNQKRDDNRPENLMAFASRSAHQKFHRGYILLDSEIIFDGRKP
jgi:hypothetical protein